MRVYLPTLSYTLPTKEMLERAKMAISRKTSPVFSYADRTTFDADSAIKAIQEHKQHVEVDQTLHPILKELEQLKLDERVTKCKLIKAIQEGDDKAVTTLSEQLYGSCEQSADYFESILKKLYERSPLPALKNDISSEDAIREFRAAMDRVNLQGWDIVQEDRTNVAVRHGDGNTPGSLRIPKDFSTSKYRLTQLIAHEIDVHAQRYESGRSSGIELFTTGTAGYLKTEEGLALYLQEEAAPSRYLPPGFWQAYSIAIAKEASFFETYQSLFKARKEFYDWIGRSDAESRAKQSACKYMLYLVMKKLLKIRLLFP